MRRARVSPTLVWLHCIHAYVCMLTACLLGPITCHKFQMTTFTRFTKIECPQRHVHQLSHENLHLICKISYLNCKEFPHNTQYNYAHKSGSVVAVLCSSSCPSYKYCSPVSLGGGDRIHKHPNMVMTTCPPQAQDEHIHTYQNDKEVLTFDYFDI